MDKKKLFFMTLHFARECKSRYMKCERQDLYILLRYGYTEGWYDGRSALYERPITTYHLVF